LKTTNGGALWSPQTGPASSEFLGLSVSSGTTAWMAREGLVWRTTNGTTWQQTDSGLSTTYKIRSTCFLNATLGWAAGDRIFRTTDGGVSWTTVRQGSANGVHFADANTGWAVGTNGSIHKSTDGGQTWSPLFSGGASVITNHLN